MTTTWRAIVAVVAALAASAAWAQRSTPVQVVHPAGSAFDAFGFAVAIDGDTMVVGSPRDDVSVSDQGSAHVYRWTGSGWSPEATLVATGGAADDRFGYSVAIAGDTIVVGSIYDDVSGVFDQGSAYVFTRVGTTWSQQAHLTASDGGVSDYFGSSVAIAGDTVVVGAWFAASTPFLYGGAAYVFTRSGASWSEQAKLAAADAAVNDSFGMSVAISGDTALVGASLDDIGAGVDQGSAYVFTRSGTSWTQQAKLVASDGSAGDRFGVSVGLVDDTAVIGASLDDVGANADQGSAYVFTRSGTSWTQQAQLNVPGGATQDRFGGSVGLSGDTAIVGAKADTVGPSASRGSASVFTRSGTTWTQQVQLTAPDGLAGDSFGNAVAISGDLAVGGVEFDDVNAAVDQGSAWAFSRVGSKWIGSDFAMLPGGAAAGDKAGSSVSISGDTAIVGVPFDDVGSNLEQGSAYVFVRTGSAWIQQAQLTATGGVTGDIFGISVSISGNTAIVGAPLRNVGANASQGTAYVFTRSGSTWSQQAQLTTIGGAADDQFGYSVAIAGDTAVVGAVSDDVGAVANQGSAYVFTRTGAAWSQQAQLNHVGAAAGDAFGLSVAIAGETVVVGSPSRVVDGKTGHGSAYVFTRVGSTWTQEAQLIHAGGETGDQLGVAVSVSGDTALVGAFLDNVGTVADQGAAYVFVRSASAWTQQARLAATDGAANDRFGSAVAISGDTAVVGAYLDDAGANVNQGSAYAFTRTGSAWTQKARLVASDGAAGDQFGYAVGLSEGTAIIGAPSDDVGAIIDQGSTWSFDVVAEDLPSAHNDVTDVTSTSLAAALLGASSGHQLTATEGAWRTVGALSTFGRSLGLFGAGDVRVPSTAAIELGGSTMLAAGSGGSVEIFGQLRSAGYVDVVGDAFRLGSRGVMTARTNASLSINASTAELDGQTRLEQGSSLTFAGTAQAIGSTTCAFESTLTAGTSFTNIDTFTITAGTINTPLFWNRAQFNVFGSSAIFGNLLNNVLATTTIRSGTLFVFGDLTNNGTVIGTICSTCSGLPPSMDIGGTLSLGPAANLTMPFVGSTVHLGGSFDCAINANTRFDLAQATLQLQSARPEVTLEVMSRDIGVDALGLDRSIAGHFPIGTLHIGGSPTTVRLVDAHDNALDGTGACEALYVDTLRIDAGSRLINTTCRIYYNTLINGGTVDVPENLIPLQGTPCPADFNMDGGVDGGDVVDFFAAWEGGDSMADVNQDG
ncbi:MAG: hypothetical protein RL689_245, partial [Planctomycetota bacterium]